MILQPPNYPKIDFSQLHKGIDNIHIDVYLTERFTKLTELLVKELLLEKSQAKRRMADKVSTGLFNKLNDFSASYQSLATAITHRAKRQKKAILIKLFQLTVIKFILTSVQHAITDSLAELRKNMFNQHDTKGLAQYDQAVWLNQHQSHIFWQINHEFFSRMQQIENLNIKPLRQSLLGVNWVLPEALLFNPLLKIEDNQDTEILMANYMYLPQTSKNHYNFSYLEDFLIKTLDDVAEEAQIKTIRINGHQHAWQDSPENIMLLLGDSNDAKTPALVSLENHLYKEDLLLAIHAANDVPRLYQVYAHKLKANTLYQGLCGEISVKELNKKLQQELKSKTLQRRDDDTLSIDAFVEAQKKLKQAMKSPEPTVIRQFMQNFVRYRRDLQYHQLTKQAMSKLHVLLEESEVHLSKTNGVLNEFLEPDEYPDEDESIRGHVILKADIRGSTTMTATLRKKDLNPATHFSHHFFDPIRQFVEDFGGEKVFIEGDAIILSFIEHQNAPEHWVSTARACGLAKNILDVVNKQNRFCRTHHLPALELGIGICHSPEAPTFLYYGDQRIMISPAIGHADRLSSCSWKLRQKYAKQDLLTRVMVFKQADDDAFKGEKGMTTFRYNLNGIELEPLAFEKLQSEIALQRFSLRLPKDKYKTNFYAGRYVDAKGNPQTVVVREGRVLIWQEQGENYKPTNELYYEVVTHKTLLTTIQKAMR